MRNFRESTILISVVVAVVLATPKCDAYLYNGFSYSTEELRYQSDVVWRILRKFCPQPVSLVEVNTWSHQPRGLAAFFLKTAADVHPEVTVGTALRTVRGVDPMFRTQCRLLVAEDRHEARRAQGLWYLPTYGASDRIVVVNAAPQPVCPDISRGSEDQYRHTMTRVWLAYHSPHTVIIQMHPSSCENWTEPRIWIHFPYRKPGARTERVPVTHFESVETLSTTRRYWDLGNKRVTAVMFPSYPTAMPAAERTDNATRCIGEGIGQIPLYENSERVFQYGRGSDVFFMKMLEEKLNLRMVPRYPLDGKFSQGEDFSNNQLTGALADMIFGDAQFTLNMRNVYKLSVPLITYMQPIFRFLELRVVVAQPPIAPLHVAIMHSFNLKVWFSIVGCYIFSAVVWSLLSSRNHCSHIIQGALKFILVGYGNLAQSPSQKFFAAACAIFSLVIVTIFQGSLVNVLTTSVHDRGIDTVEDLLKSELPIVTNSSSRKHVFRRAAEVSPVMKELYKRIRPTYTYTMSEGLLTRKLAAVVSEDGFNSLRTYNIRRANGLRIVKGIYAIVPQAYAVRIDCPIKEQVEKILWRIWESGIGLHFDKEVERREFGHCNFTEDVPQPFNLNQFKIAFYTLFFGLCLSSFVFLLELVNYKRLSMMS